MPFFKRSASKKGRSKSQDEKVDKTTDKPAVQNGQVVDQYIQPEGQQKWAEGVFKEQGWSDDVMQQKQVFAAHGQPTPPSSPLKYNEGVTPMSRSRSQPQALPYHRPWNRHLASSQADPSQQPESVKEASSSREAGAVPQSRSWSQSSLHSPKKGLNLPTSAYPNGNIADFRISPSAFTTPTPAQRKQYIDTARRISLKKAKAPSEFNILVMGGRMTGKTSWIRTLLSTCDLGHCNEETKIAAAHFGIAASNGHSTRRTDPITPLSTKSIDYLGGIELQTNSLLPLASLDEQIRGNGTEVRPPSHVSTRASIFSTSTSNSSKRLHLSICDTPGIDFDLEDEFETQRKVSKIVKHVESKLTKTLTEEGKVQRRSKSDDYVHLIVYFIDPRHLVERSETRRKEVRQSRTVVGGAAEERRARSNSESQAHGPLIGSFMKSHDSHINGHTGEVSEEEASIEGLSPTEVNIIAKMSKYANVLPIIAKADTLTLSRLYEVRQAVRRSLKAAKVDLGTFDFASSKNRRKKQSVSRNEMVETLAAERDETPAQIVDKQDVKVVRLRPRRSFSANGARPGSSTIGHGEESEGGHSNYHSHNNSLQSTEPLFPGGVEEEEDDDTTDKAHEELLRLMPLSLFVPEPIQVYRKKKSFISKLPASAEDQEAEVLQTGVPPVPRLPRIPYDGAVSVDSGNVNPRDLEEYGTALSPTLIEYPHSYSSPATLLPSNRYERNYRWGTANVLDAEQCDFGLLRSTILGTHLDALKESTSMRYEAFRSRRLELTRQLQQEQGTAPTA